jgi:hypothetical protein
MLTRTLILLASEALDLLRSLAVLDFRRKLVLEELLGLLSGLSHGEQRTSTRPGGTSGEKNNKEAKKNRRSLRAG